MSQLTHHCKKYTHRFLVTQPKTFKSKTKSFTNFPANIFLIGVRKNISKAPFLDLEELHSWSTWKENFYMFLQISIKQNFQWYRMLLSGGWLNYFLEAALCISLIKCFKVFHFKWNFWRFNYFSAFRYFDQSTEMLKLSRQSEIQG